MAEIKIEPITRILGDARIRILLDEGGQPDKAYFQAFGYRGFEQMAAGAHVDNLLPIVSRICGSDSVFHQVAGARAVQNSQGFTPPGRAMRLCELAMWAQLFERHAVSLTVHSLPDLLFPSSDQGVRNIISIHRVDEEVAKRVLALKSLGTSVLNEVAGGAVHPVNFVPGGVVRDIREETRSSLVERLEQAKPLLAETAHLMKMLLRRNEEAVNNLGTAPMSHLSIKGDGEMILTGDRLEVVGVEGESRGGFSPLEAVESLEDIGEPHSHIKSVRLSELGSVRVGALARINVNRLFGTTVADGELEEIKSLWGFPLQQTMVGHAVRMMEMMHAWDKMMEILQEVPGEKTYEGMSLSSGRGVGVVEGPEGILLYDLVIDDEGRVERLAVTAPLQFNLPGLESSLEEGARYVLAGGERGERVRNRLEMAVRAYAPCTLCGVR